MGVFDSIGDLFTGGSHIPMRRTEVNFPQPPQQPVLPSDGISQNMIIYGIIGVAFLIILVKK